MKIAILADSLSLPRGKDWGDVAYEETYPYLINAEMGSVPAGGNAVVIERGMRFRTIEKVLDDWTEIVTLRKVDVAIIHVGIVDCAPRVFTPRERYFVEHKLPGLIRGRLLKFVHRFRKEIVAFRPNNVYVPPDTFKKKIAEVITRAREDGLKLLIFVNIIVPLNDLEERSPGYQRNVRVYNDIIAQSVDGSFSRFIDLNQIVIDNGGANKLTCDGMHINAAGHKLLSQAIADEVVKYGNSSGAGL